MPSNAFQELKVRLDDVGELIDAHIALTGGNRGRRYRGPAITRAGIVLLGAATEAYVEDLFDECAKLIFTSMSADELDKFKKATSRQMNNSDVYKIELLYFNLGCPFVLKDIRWQKCSNSQFKTKLNKLVVTRNQIAHGKRPKLGLASLRSWTTMIENFAPRLQDRLRDHVEEMTGTRPPWP